MALSREQKRKLGRILSPIIRHSMESAVGPIVKEELDRITQHDRQGTRYADKVFASAARAPAGPIPKGHSFARVVRAFMAAGGDIGEAVDTAYSNGFGDQVVRALEAGSAEGGGLLIPAPMADEVIELLRPRSVIRRAGPRTITIPAGNMQFPRIDSGSTAAYVGEGQEISVSELKTGAVNLSAKKLAALTLLSNDLLRFGINPDVDAIVLEDLLQAISQAEDVKMLFGSGADAEPMGIVNQIVASHKFNAGAATLSEVRTSLRQAEEKLRSSDVPMQRPAWFMAPRTRLFLRDLNDQDDRPVFKDEINRGRLNDIPLFDSNNIPIDGGSGSDSQIILVDMAEVMLGQVSSVEIARSDAAMINVGGVSQSLFQRDRSAIRTIMRNDVVLRHNVSGAVIQQVTWGT